MGGTIVYCANGKADGVYWAGVAALWTATLGFGAKTKSEEQKASKEIGTKPNLDGGSGPLNRAESTSLLDSRIDSFGSVELGIVLPFESLRDRVRGQHPSRPTS
jgi:hypothetical protein